MEALTKTGRIITKTVEGRLPEIQAAALIDELDILNLEADYWALVKSFYVKGRLPVSAMAVFFTDFARTQACGLSVTESIDSLKETTNNQVLRTALKDIGEGIDAGRSVKEAFDNAGCFPGIVIVFLAAAEKSGSIPKIAAILGHYFKFNHDSRKKIIAAMIYPAMVFCALTAAAVIISINLVPQLSRILPSSSMDNAGTRMLLAYAMFMKSYWWTMMLIPVLTVFCVRYLWTEHKERLAAFVYAIPLLGKPLKEIEFTRLFLNLYVYQQSGIPIIESMTNIYNDDPSFINERLLLVRSRIMKGQSIGDAFKSDPFFPSLIALNLSKGQKAGELVKYLEETYLFYDQQSKDSMTALVNMINPVLLSLAIAFLGFIVCNFFLPIYKSMAGMSIVFR